VAFGTNIKDTSGYLKSGTSILNRLSEMNFKVSYFIEENRNFTVFWIFFTKKTAKKY
jgi:hypothetical protein